MAAIPDEKLQEIRDRVDIVDLIGRYVELRQAGQNFKGLCPFHQERTPSFNVNPARKGFKCFGCGQGGDAIAFVMELEGKSFPEALRKLAELYGVTLPAHSRANDSGGHERDEAYAITKAAAALYREILAGHPEGEAGRAYVQARGLEAAVVERFALGYAPAPREGGWDRLVRALGDAKLSLPLAERLGLVGRSERSDNWYDRFRGRLMFPILVPGGEVVAFSGRIVPPHDQATGDDAVPKYINSPESLLYTKGKTLFGLHEARPAVQATGRAILVEGNLDVVRLHQWGFPEAVAPLGTALTADQAKLLARFCNQVVMAFDGDQAGKKAAWAALPHLLEADLDARMVLLPPGEDPDSIGPERFKALLAKPEAALVEMMTKMAERAGGAVDARAQALDRLLPLIAQAPRESQRQLYADRAIELFDLPRARVETSLRNLRKANQTPAVAPKMPQENSRDLPSTSRGPVPVSAAVRSMPPLPAGQASLAMLLVDVPHLAGVAEEAGALQWITDPRLAPIARAVVDGAHQGIDRTMPDLLALVDPAAQSLVHDTVFAGRYRDLSDQDPQALLHALVHRCHEHALDAEIHELDRQIKALEQQGLPAEASELAQRRLDVRRRQAALRAQALD